MLEALLIAVIYCVIVFLIAWLLVSLIGLIPVPQPFAGIIPTIIWIVAIIICLVLLLRVVQGTALGIP